jgi:hypothetical protein
MTVPELAVLPPEPQPNGAAAPLRAIDRIRRLERANRRSMECPWWEMTVYWRPTTLADYDMVEERKPRNGVERMILILIHKLESENGDRLFDWGDKLYLMREVEAVHLQDIADQVLGVRYKDKEAALAALDKRPGDAVPAESGGDAR